MQHFAFKIFFLLGISSLHFSCKEELPTRRPIAEKYAKPTADNLALQKKREALQKKIADRKKRESEKIIVSEKPKKKIPLSFPFQLAPDFSAFSEQLKEPIGEISGDIFGEKNPLYAILKAQCGEGTILQAVYKSKNLFQISPPIPLRFLGLQTEKEVRYSEGDFDLVLNFSKDSPDKLKGSFQIQYRARDGSVKNYISLKMDAKPFPFLFPTKMKGEGHLPEYDWCSPTAYVGIKRTPKDEMVFGYAHIQNTKNLDLPLIRVMLSDRDGMDLLLIPLSRGEEIPKNTEIDVKKATKRGNTAAVLRIETWHLDEISPANEASGVNLKKPIKTSMLDGKAIVELKKGKPWQVDIQLLDAEVSPIMIGPFSEEHFSEIRIFGNLSPEGEMKSALPVAPNWWKKSTSKEEP